MWGISPHDASAIPLLPFEIARVISAVLPEAAAALPLPDVVGGVQATGGADAPRVREGGKVEGDFFEPNAEI